MRLAIALILTSSLSAQVTYQRILKAESEPGNWLTYSGNYSAHRFSSLDQINEGNVSALRPIWSYQVTSLQKFETTPIVVDGIMYISEPPSNVTALDTRTGRPLWKYRRNLPEDVRVCCGQVNRGVAILGDLVYVGTIDAHLVALNAKTGAVMWDTTVANYKSGHSITVRASRSKGQDRHRHRRRRVRRARFFRRLRCADR